MNTLGQKIAGLRKEKGLTQETLAERLSVSPQAVSKWENDQSCPDITLLPALADILGITVDELLRSGTSDKVRLLPVEKRKPLDELVLHIFVSEGYGNGSKVKVNLPLPLVKAGLELGMSFPKIADKLPSQIDLQPLLQQTFELAERGLIGKLVEVSNGDDLIEIVVD